LYSGNEEEDQDMDDKKFGKKCKKPLGLGFLKKESKNFIQNVAKKKESKLKAEKCSILPKIFK
jgi:hypothetical protein